MPAQSFASGDADVDSVKHADAHRHARSTGLQRLLAICTSLWKQEISVCCNLVYGAVVDQETCPDSTSKRVAK